MAFLTGDGGYVDIGGQRLDVEKWSLTTTISVDEATNTGSGGFYEGIGCVKKAVGKVDAKWDAAVTPTGTVPGVILGAEVHIKLYVGDSGEYYDFPVAMIISVPVENDAKLAVKFSFDFENHGTFTEPT